MSAPDKRIAAFIDRVVQEADDARRRALALMSLGGDAQDRIARLLQRADEVWENPVNADLWARTRLAMLDGRSPISLAAESEQDLERALVLMERLEYGVYTR